MTADGVPSRDPFTDDMPSSDASSSGVPDSDASTNGVTGSDASTNGVPGRDASTNGVVSAVDTAADGYGAIASDTPAEVGIADERMRRSGGRRSARNVDQVVVISWRDIPAQVTATQGGHKETVVLHHRFQAAIDRAATVAGLTSTQAYVAEWRRDVRPLRGPAAQAAADLAAELELTYDRPRLEALVWAGGLADAAAAHSNGHDAEALAENQTQSVPGTPAAPPNGHAAEAALGPWPGT